jgi:DNA-binding MarR family transcriptional regulator
LVSISRQARPAPPTPAVPPELVGRLDEALGTITRGATKQRRHRARLDAAGVQLSIPGFHALQELCSGGAMGPTALAAQLDMPPGQVSREVKALVEAGLVTRTVAPGDGRAAVLRPTAAGRRAASRYRAAGREQIAAVVAAWPTADVAALTELLERFAADVRRVQGNP